MYRGIYYKITLLFSAFILIINQSCEKDPVLYSVSVSVDPIEAGSVTPEYGLYEYNEKAVITATPNPFYGFTFWSGYDKSNSSTIVLNMNECFELTANFIKIDDDEDGVLNNIDLCNNTPRGLAVDSSGCSLNQKDSDSDGIPDDIDLCMETRPNANVNSKGCEFEIFSFSSNGITIIAADESEVGMQQEFNGNIYTVVDSAILYEMVNNGEDLSYVVTSKVNDMSFLFDQNEINGDITSWDTSNVSYFQYMFKDSSFNQDISSWDTSSANYLNGMFQGSDFNQDISSWNTFNVTDMSYTFKDSSFNQDISSWNVSNVEDMTGMFQGSSFNQDISSWDVSSLKKIAFMFSNSDFNQDISSWNITSVDTCSGFAEGTYLTFIDIPYLICDQDVNLTPEKESFGSNDDIIETESGDNIIFVNDDTTLTNDRIWTLDATVVVKDGVTLTIEPGTIIKATENYSSLVIEKGGKIFAEGTPELPIVFTDNNDLLSYKEYDRISPNRFSNQYGYWGGIIILGAAIIGENDGQDNLATLGSGYSFSNYGGFDDSQSSGVLKYISIRHAGGDNLSSLTLAGVGSGTIIENIEVFSSKTDGIRIYGGSSNLKYLSISNVLDDAIDIDEGYHGSIENTYIILSDNSDSNIEADGTEHSSGQNNSPSYFNNIHTVLDVNPTKVNQLGHWRSFISGYFSNFSYQNITIQKIKGIDNTTYKGTCQTSIVSSCLNNDDLFFSNFNFIGDVDLDYIFSNTQISNYLNWSSISDSINLEWTDFRVWTNYYRLFN